MGVVCELARLCAPLQQQLQSCCLDALNGSASAATGSAAVLSSAPAAADLSAAQAHPRPLCMLLCALLDESDEAFNARVWSAVVQALQNRSVRLLSVRIPKPMRLCGSWPSRRAHDARFFFAVMCSCAHCVVLLHCFANKCCACCCRHCCCKKTARASVWSACTR